ncbi:tRNA threonylcarbamoyladenosine biosynthesis protein TsaB [Bradyrhizobium sp. Rc2d]|uniref:tRNA (adenosine(37)-N6)-threonylcarbamoyltransferase complex dimerization subunit type 1 TsaB n=1 Tax=Bradyrhizobium sp. Rc2d TaxID=1855321 RepID=UPI00088D1741|nr:tRNA (adenosine(37)-N6)-threonylcarbamoyltransferase complex dimerization subunit type 1 TsaB [Bradyrhizobium sp. Rc2d]SDG92815.1 tRNA threonylcarbamoyladenosine biosynthesis protein TsaB [Bradyrhizobium sp. Rc2d]
MLILAIDTALDACSAAVLDTETAELRAQESLPMKRGHAEALMPLIARVMQSAELGFAALDRIAVTVGPGSFTGLRVGISAARGLALAANRPAVGLTTLSAYAAAIVGQSRSAPVMSAIDARHDHVYFQIVAGDGSQLVRPKVASIDEAIAASQFGAPHLVGNAANILAERWPTGAPQPIAVDTHPAPDIGWVAWLGAAANPDTTPARPFYLRAPDAKPAAQLQLAAQAASS